CLNELVKDLTLYNQLQGTIYNCKQQYVKALECYMKNEIDNLNSIGINYFDQKNYELAFEYFFRDFNKENSFGTASWLALTYDRMGNLRECVKWYKRSEELVMLRLVNFS